MATHEIRDITIIGAGPAGLFALFYAGMRGATAQIVDALSQPGGQLAALYPEKYIFDVAGYPKVLAKDLVHNLVQQAGQFGQPIHCGQNVIGLEEEDGHFVLVTETDRFPTRAVIIAAGIGAFSPRRLPQACAEPWYGRGIDDVVLDPKKYEGKRVVIIGGGDTGADCLGTAIRQGAKSIHQFELMPRPPLERAPGNPWPEWPHIFRVSSAHEEGGERVFSISTQCFTGNADGHVTQLHAVQVERRVQDGRLSFEPIPGTETVYDVDLVLLAMGFVGPERNGLLEQLGVRLTDRGTVWADENWMTSVPGVFTAGDMQRGQSLIVWAIAEGRSAARGVDAWLMGRSDLPAPLQR